MRKERSEEQKARVLGFAWYRPDQWELLREFAPDGDQLEDHFEEWQEGANKALRELESLGQRVEKVDINVVELVTWCNKNGRLPDGPARAAFTAEKIRSKYAKP